MPVTGLLISRVFAICILAAVNSPQIRSAEFKGQITWNLLRNGAEVITNVYSVQAFADTGRLAITVSGEAGENLETEEVSIENGTCYFVRSRWPSWQKKRANQEQSQFAVVDSESFPSTANRVTQLVWMALADTYATNLITPSIFPSRLDVYLDPARVTCAYFPSFDEENATRIEGQASPFVRLQGTEFRLSGTAGNGFAAWKVSVVKHPLNRPQMIKAVFQQYFPVEIAYNLEYRPEAIYKAECVLNKTDNKGAFKIPTLLPGVNFSDKRLKGEFKAIKGPVLN